MNCLKSLSSGLRNDSINTIVLNYLTIVYIFSLTISYKIDGIIIWIIFVLFVFNENFIDKIKNSMKNQFVQACLLYFTIHFIWMLGSNNLDTAFYLIKYNKPLVYSLLFMAFIQKEFIQKFIVTFIIGVTINAIWSYGIFFGLLSQPHFANQPGSYLPILNKIDYSFFVLITLGYSLYRILRAKILIGYELFFVLFFVFETCNLFLTGSRTSMISYIIMVFFIVIYSYRKSFLRIIYVMSIIICFFLSSLYFLFPSVLENVKQESLSLEASIIANNYNSSSGSRIGMLKYSALVIKDNFIFGVGTGDHIEEVSFKMHLSPEFSQQGSFYEIVRVFGAGHSAKLHNSFAEAFVQFGIIGVMSLTLIFISALRSGFLTNEHRLLAFSIILLAFIGMNTGYGFGENNFGKFFIVILCALIAKSTNSKKDSACKLIKLINIFAKKDTLR